jgi:mono/diheme cytochrome c family protein
MSAAPRLLLALGLALGAPLRAAEETLAERAQVILTRSCHQCHGQGGSSRGGLSFVLDRDQLVSRGLVTPGKPADSELLRRVLAREMPPANKPPLEAAQVNVLRDWIASGAPSLPRTPRSFLGPAKIVQAIEEDLRSFSPRQRRFLRYASFTHLYDANRPDAELETAGHALSKLLNSLSWHPRVTRPVSVDQFRTVYRVDLRDYRWSSRTWDRLASAYPYRAPNTTESARACAEMTGSEVFHVRGDWLVATASRGKLYYDLLELPSTDRGLERLLQVDVARGFREETAFRAGFNGSGVSRNNRVIERHDSIHGPYWRSHDFSDNTDRQNIFENPLGPVAGQHSFRPAGGEIIFQLPNALQGFLLVDADGRRVEKGPVEIVSDPNRPDRQVEAGISCMNCHGKGLLPKDDQVRAHVEKNAAAFPREVLDAVRALYPPPKRLRALMEADTRRYLAALAATGVPPDANDPVSAVTLRYESVLDLALAGGELGVRAEELARQLTASSGLQRLLGPLQARGTVQRQVFEEKHSQIVANVRPTLVVEKVERPRQVEGSPAFVGHTDAVLCLALSPDGRLALSGGQDHTLRLWDVADGRLLRSLDSHTAAVSCVAVSPDGKLALSGSVDRTVRLWDLEEGKEIAVLRGHLDRVRAVTFSPDGKLALSAGQDRTARVWDMATRKPLQLLTGHAGPVACVCFSPDGKLALSGGADGSVRLWDVKEGVEKARWEAHRRGVHCVAFSPDGKRAASGGEDRVVRLWDVASGNSIRALSGHANAPLAVKFSGDGSRVWSASGQNETEDRFLRVWDAAKGAELAGRRGEASVWCVAFTPDGKGALTGGTDRRLRRWVVESPNR